MTLKEAILASNGVLAVPYSEVQSKERAVKQVSSPSNSILAALPRGDQQLIMENCELVELVIADVIDKCGDSLSHVYFPINSIISLVMPIDGSSGLEVRLIGNEGMFGINLLLGVDVTPFHAVVQGGGPALRMTKSSFMDALEQSPALMKSLKRYLYVLFSQLVQTSGCHRFHVVEERLARLLLMIRDRAHSETFHITQELLSQMLGVRRVGVTKAASSLQQKNLINYSRGNVNIHDIIGLEAVSCSCYRIDKETYARILKVN